MVLSDGLLETRVRGYNKDMGYYNYHGVVNKLIKEGHLVRAEIVDRYNGISPALVLYFDCHRPMPIRQEKWYLYEEKIFFATKKRKE